MKEYKVVELKSGMFSDNIKNKEIESFLNSYASSGWVFKELIEATGSMSFILERDK